MGRRRRDTPTVTAEAVGCSDIELRSAICIYLIAERQGGATVGEIARLTLGGRSPSEEVPRVSKAVSQLLQEDHVWLEGEKVCPILAE